VFARNAEAVNSPGTVRVLKILFSNAIVSAATLKSVIRSTLFVPNAVENTKVSAPP
jgi:hypothetical protein